MLNVLCWKPEHVVGVINIEANSIPPSVFRAVDTDTPGLSKDGERGTLRETTTDELVDRFLDPTHTHMQMAVLGPSGAGKSHLIRRLEQRIIGRAGSEVLVIQRLETNLRAILEKLIRRLPESDRIEFEKELRQAGHSLTTPDVQKSALLDGLAQAIQEDVSRPDSGIDAEAEIWLLEHLPNLLRDPYLREEKFLRSGEIISELVDRLFSNREGKRLEERVLFEADNLPRVGIRLEQCAAPVRNVVEYYLFDEATTIPNVLAVLNRNLDRAIARTLNFSGERLIELMETLRARLANQKKELILLFEEFARLQGYDSAMLEALLKQGGSDDGRTLCNVRWAIACTSGRFGALPDTVRTRMDLIVDMETAAPNLDLAEFSGRYLNAVRLGRRRLDSIPQHSTNQIPNACEGCEWRSECSAAFGATDEGYGLYPFTKMALYTMAQRADPDAATRFNPRTFQRNVLRTVLIDEAPALEEGSFPTPALLEKLGGAVISPTDRVRLHEKAGGQFDRYLSLLQLWADGKLNNPAHGVSLAFGLKELSGLEKSINSEPEPTAKLGTPEPGHRTLRPPRPLDAQRKRLGDRPDGGPMDQALANKLRVKLYPYVEQAIDWDREGLLPNLFANATGTRPLRQTSINFVAQMTTGATPPPVRFELPFRRDPANFANTARALEMLLAFDETSRWEDAGGLDGMAAVRELVDECATEALSQLRSLRKKGGVWDPVDGAVEMLAVGAALGGVFNSQMDDVKLVGAVFASIPEDSAVSDGPLRSIYDLLKKRRESLITLVRAHVSGSKGGRQGRFIDPRQVVKVLRRLRRNKWVLSGEPVDLAAPYSETGDIYGRMVRELRPALEEERRLRLDWLTEMEENFGNEENRQKILEAVTRLLDVAIAAGLPTRRKALEEARTSFATVQFGDALRAARSLKTADPPETELPAFARSRDNAVQASSNLARAWRDFASETEAEVRVLREQHGVLALETEKKKLDSTLGELIEELNRLEGKHVAA